VFQNAKLETIDELCFPTADALRGSLFNPEDGDYIVFRNVGEFLSL
jgi:hypothetical protein